jgi:signal peptidase
MRAAVRNWGAVAAIAVVVVSVFLLRPGVVNSPVSWVVVAGDSMLPTLQSGDVVFVKRKGSYDKGDVVAYRVPEGDPGAGIVIIHRIVGSDRHGYRLQGDNKDGLDPWQPEDGDVVGSMFFDIPRLGLAVGFLRTPMGFAALAAIVTFSILAGGTEAGRRRRKGDPPSPPEPVPLRTRPLALDPLPTAPASNKLLFALGVAALGVVAVGVARRRR